MENEKMNKNKIIKHFPNIQIPDDFYIHKLNYSDTFIALPKGRKCILWFTTHIDENIPIVLYLDNNYTIVDCELFNICFDNELTLGKGTIINGIIFKINNIFHFCCIDIHYYKGQLIETSKFKDKLKVFEYFFKYNIKQTLFNENTLIVGLPLCKTNYNELISFVEYLPYPIHAIKLFKYNSIYHSGLIKYKEKEFSYAYFNIKATLEDDIYNVFCCDKTTPYGIAMITDFKTSVMMNKLFRNIKENDNLDLLELSDDENEFENVQQDKFVDLNKTICMKCIYVPRFKKWKPLSIAPKYVKPIKFSDVSLLERKFYYKK